MVLMRADPTMFDDARFFCAVRAHVAPLLRTYPFSNAWVLGCGGGEPAYALAIALHEEGLGERTRVHATDARERLLSRAREGAYALSSLVVARAGYTTAGGRANLSDYYEERGSVGVMREDLRAAVTFAHHTPAVDTSFVEAQLVYVCDGALADLGTAEQRRAWGVVHESLCRFGLLAVAKRERYPMRGSYEHVAGSDALYRKGADA